MGFSRSSSSTTSNVNTYNFANYGGDKGGPAQNFNIAGNAGAVNIQASDYGAIEGGLSLAQQALSRGTQAFSDAIAAVSSNANTIVARTLDIASKNQVSESAQFQGTLLKLGLIVGAVVAALAYAKRG